MFRCDYKSWLFIRIFAGISDGGNGMKKYEAYKTSGVEWIGEIPVGWDVRKLKFFIDCNKKVLPETTSNDYQIEYIDISNVNSRGEINSPQLLSFKDAPSRARRILRKNDIILSTVRTYLKAIARIDEEKNNLIASTGFAVFSPTEKVTNSFLFYLLLNSYFLDDVVSCSKGVSYPAITSSDLINILAILPPLPEQTAIAQFLDHKTALLDRIIRTRGRQIELLKEERKAIINKAVTKGKGISKNVRLKPSGIEWLGDIPDHWDFVKLKRVLKGYLAGPFGSRLIMDKLLDTGKIKVYTPQHLTDNILEQELFLPEHRIHEMRQFKIKLDDVIIPIVGTLGRAQVFTKKMTDGIINQRMAKLTPKTEKISPTFLKIILSDTAIYKDYFDLVAKGAILGHLTKEQILTLPVALPSVNEQQIIITYIEEKTTKIDTLISKYEKQITLLEEYRTSLISKAVTGQIDVREWKPKTEIKGK
jgi:restriction endonuclease S subunit